MVLGGFRSFHVLVTTRFFNIIRFVYERIRSGSVPVTPHLLSVIFEKQAIIRSIVAHCSSL